jgi:hypothetical protein
MHDLLENTSFDTGETAAASQDRGGLSRRPGCIAFPAPTHFRTPRAANSRGVRVFAIRESADRAFRQAPICHHPRRPGPSGRAPHP